MTLHTTLVLTGMMGSGKTTLGKALADTLGAPFIDADHEIEKEAGASIPALFAAHGEAAFRAREARMIAKLLDGPKAVIATGGGAILDAGTRRLIHEKARAIWLQADIETLFARVSGDTNRPLLQKPDPKKALADLLAARKSFYAEAPFHIATDGRSFDAILAELVAVARKAPTL